MTRKLSFLLLLIALTVVVLLFNSRDSLSVNLVFGSVKMLRSLWLLAFTGIGVAIGLLLK